MQWEINQGKCGLCGDPWNAEVREHEAPGGKFATGTVVRSYSPGQIVEVIVEVTANHLGTFTFRLCPVPDPQQDPSQDCLDLHPLITSSGSEVWSLPSAEARSYNLSVVLPSNMECEHCLLQ